MNQLVIKYYKEIRVVSAYKRDCIHVRGQKKTVTFACNY